MAVMQYSSLIKIVDPELPQTHSEKCYDLAIIGAGISSAFTLIHYIGELESRSDRNNGSLVKHQPVKIAVTEKCGEFWTGMPYGSRSGRSALLITSLKEFIPQPEERQKFVDWLVVNRDRIFDPQQFDRGEMSCKWLQDNAAAMNEGLWDELFLPRYTFGLYIKERLTNSIDVAQSKGWIEVELIPSDVIDIRYIQNSYYIDLVPGNYEDETLVAKKIVLAIGSPPNLGFDRSTDAREAEEICYIDNMYEPSLGFNLDRIYQALATADSSSSRQLLVIGSNASTLDTLYSLNNSKTLTNLIDKFIILSPSASFPHRISREIVEIDYVPHHLVALSQSEATFTAKQILEAVQQDVSTATDEGINISDIYTDISKVVIQCMEKLNFGQQKQFVSRYAVEIGKLQRRAGGEYLDVVDDLISQNKLSFIKGKFVKYLPSTEEISGCEYVDSSDREQKVFAAPIKVVINCAGFQDVTRSSSPLIQNLLRREICQPNESNRGFIVDKNFEASKNCYVMGPLLAGNIDGNFRVWHAESCQRIISFSQNLVKSLMASEPQVLAMKATESNVEVELAAAS
jgi:uncharacterized NAD(P)/FAD-binding protein YdhS